MPKKTRQEKIIAGLRRKVAISPRPAFTPSPVISPSSQTQSFYVYPPQLIKKDLTRTFILAILAVSLELAIYLIK